MADEHRDQIRIVQETVAGKEITFAHVMGGPAPIIYQKLGLNPQVDYRSSAIGIMNMTPSESAVIASDIAVKSGNILPWICRSFLQEHSSSQERFQTSCLP